MPSYHVHTYTDGYVLYIKEHADGRETQVECDGDEDWRVEVAEFGDDGNETVEHIADPDPPTALTAVAIATEWMNDHPDGLAPEVAA